MANFSSTDLPIEHAEPLEDSKAHTKEPHNPKEINPKMAADIAYWAKELHVTGQLLHETIRVHGTHVDKVRAALAHRKTA